MIFQPKVRVFVIEILEDRFGRRVEAVSFTTGLHALSDKVYFSSVVIRNIALVKKCKGMVLKLTVSL